MQAALAATILVLTVGLSLLRPLVANVRIHPSRAATVAAIATSTCVLLLLHAVLG